MAAQPISNSTFLDFSGYRQVSDTSASSLAAIEAAYNITAGTVSSTGTLNIALVVDRANDPTDLLNSNWATRQQTIAQLNASGGSIWDTYGASTQDYQTVYSGLQALSNNHLKIIGDASGSDGYVTSQQSRTIWVSVDPTGFQSLFGTGTTLYSGTVGQGSSSYTVNFWTGSLTLPSTWNVVGIAPDEGISPNVLTNLGGSATTTLPQGSQSIGNSTTNINDYYPYQISSLYNFPLDSTVPTGTIGLIEPAVGDAMQGAEANNAATTAQFQSQLNAYRQLMANSSNGAYVYSSGDFYVVSNNGQASGSEKTGGGGERTLDVSTVAGAAPMSTVGLYAGSGTNHNAQGTTYTTYQAAFWDTTNNPEIVSSSWGDAQQSTPGSVFQVAQQELFVDAALRNISVFSAVGDGGSGDQMANGLTNLQYSYSSPYGILVGGTSLSTASSAATDPTLSSILAAVNSGNLLTLWQLIAGGMTQLPASAGDPTVIETVWNQYVLSYATLNPGYNANNTGTGGVDPTQPTPWYQTAFGLTPTTSDNLAQTGRGAPDVSAVAGGNMLYKIPDPNMDSSANNIQDWFGTSAAAPLWASLYAQFNAIFHDQGLPNLGYSNDLLYIAAAIAPGSFNDITFGSNTSSFYAGGAIQTPGYSGGITPTGYGYSAAPGYDLVTGLGTPNGVLLARALTAIAHAQMYGDAPDVLGLTSSGAYATTVNESLLFQPVLASAAHVELHVGGAGYAYDGSASGGFAWTAQYAQQVLQSDFSSALVTPFDGQHQAAPFQSTLQAGTTLSMTIGGAATTAPQAGLTTPYGFVDFVTAGADSGVQVARPLSVADTAGGANDVDAVVRMRQVGTSSLDVLFYKVDDYAGTVSGLAPGQAGYEAAVQAHAYQTTAGGNWIDGPGFGAFAQTEITHVNSGDLVAMALQANGHTYYAFTGANADGTTHLWNYGLNTYGWEDLYGGGDQDYNDLVVQLDFTSTAGHGYLLAG